MILIYSDHHVVDFWIASLKFWQDYKICHDLNEFILSNVKVKLSFTKGRTFDYDNPMIHDNQLFADYIIKLSECSNFVFSFDTEIHDFHWEIWDNCHRDNIFWITSGFVNDKLIGKNVINWLFFFDTINRNYNRNYNGKLQHKLQNLQSHFPKNKIYDALLGRNRLHRTFVYDSLKNLNLFDNSIVSYQTSDDVVGYVDFWKNFKWEAETINPYITNPGGTEQYYNYNGLSMPLSQILPIEIYNESAYSIIAETGFSNRYSLITEKTAKPLLAKRIFITFSGYKFLENLKLLGFKTFDGIIDESYDLVTDNEQRWTMAMQQAKILSQLDQETTYSKAKDILEHNYNNFMCTDWTGYAITQIQSKIDFLADKYLT
jgi:hypothetical protein